MAEFIIGIGNSIFSKLILRFDINTTVLIFSGVLALFFIYKFFKKHKWKLWFNWRLNDNSITFDRKLPFRILIPLDRAALKAYEIFRGTRYGTAAEQFNKIEGKDARIKYYGDILMSDIDYLPALFGVHPPSQKIEKIRLEERQKYQLSFDARCLIDGSNGPIIWNELYIERARLKKCVRKIKISQLLEA